MKIKHTHWQSHCNKKAASKSRLSHVRAQHVKLSGSRSKAAASLHPSDAFRPIDGLGQRVWPDALVARYPFLDRKAV